MSTVPSGFDYVFQVDEGVINKVLQGQHSHEIQHHRLIRRIENKHIEVLINKPSTELVSSSSNQASGPETIILHARLHYWSRLFDDKLDPGTSAVVDVRIPVFLDLSCGNPGRVDDNTEINLNWKSGIKISDISIRNIHIHGYTVKIKESPILNNIEKMKEYVFNIRQYSEQHKTASEEVTGNVLALIKEPSINKIILPSIGTPDRRVRNVAFRIHSTEQGIRFSLGMTEENDLPSEKSRLSANLVRLDWALALSDKYVKNHLLEKLKDRYTKLPPPYGSENVLLSSREICTIPNPFGGCIKKATQKAYLTKFELSLQEGRIAFNGSIKIKTNEIFIPDISGRFSAASTLQIGNDETITVNITEFSVELIEWYAVVANFISLNTLKTAIRDGMRESFQSATESPAIGTIITQSVINQIASISEEHAPWIQSISREIEIKSDSVVLHGDLQLSDLISRPKAQFIVYPGKENGMYIFHGGGSWAPGDVVENFTWNFGDGNTETYSQEKGMFIATHKYLGTDATVSLAVKSMSGNMGSTTKKLDI